MQYLYQIAGCRVLCEIPFEVHMEKIYEPFLKKVDQLQEPADKTVIFREIEEISVSEDVTWVANHGYGKQKVYYRSAPQGIVYACVDWQRAKEGILTCTYGKGCEEYINFARNIPELISMEMLLLELDCLLLHAAFIKWNEKGILFTAPSGTGKSTQADLWGQWECAKIINGDRAALAKNHEGWRAYGIPFAGSSGIFCNESAKIQGVVVIRQGSENCIRKLDKKEAFLGIYPELTFHRWESGTLERVMNLLEMLIDDCPVYLLECRPDKEAVDVLKNEILKGELGRC